MLWYPFELGNVVSYLTTPAAEPPRASRKVLKAWFAGGGRGVNLIAASSSFQQTIDMETQRCSDVLDHLPDHSRDELTAEEVATVLQPIRRFFGGHLLIALEVFSSRADVSAESTRSLKWLAEKGDGHVLVLQPSDMVTGYSNLPDRNGSLPQYETALEHRPEWPGVLFWSKNGESAFVTSSGLHDAVRQLVSALRDHGLSGVDHVLRTRSHGGRAHVLHLSDLHFGSMSAANNMLLLLPELHRLSGTGNVGRVVISGDLFDNPNDAGLAQFGSFAQQLHMDFGSSAVVVPGNHDQRWKGNLGRARTQIAALEWSAHVVDHNLRTVFLNFDSARSGNFARGKIGSEQLTAVTGLHTTTMAADSRLRDYLRVAVVHHHPYSFESAPSTWYQKLLARLGLGDEQFMAMDDAEQFVDWCARWRVSVVLHGHKHVGRYESRRIEPVGAMPHDVTAVGCGSSLGAEGSALGYVLLSWNERRATWFATFYESRNAGPFIPALITVVRPERRADPVFDGGVLL